MKNWIIGVGGILAITLIVLFPYPSLAAVQSVNVNLTVVCYNVSINLTTDKTSYQYTDVANMTVFLNNTDNSNNLNDILLIELYDTGENFVSYMITDNATAPGNGTNTTSYYRNLSDVSTGDYIMRARLVPGFTYPGQNATARDCTANSTAVQSDVNVTVTALGPNPPTNIRLILNKTSNETTLNWTLSNSTNISNYVIYVTDDYSTGFNYSNPYTTVSNTTTNWTDTDSDGVDERYYVVRANNTLGLTDGNTYAVGKYNLKLYTGWNLISLPLLIWNESMSDVLYTAENGDISERWDGAGQSYDRTDYFAGFGWFGDFTTAQVDRGYWYYSLKSGYVSSPFNNTIVGAVPTASRSETIYNKTWSLLGWTSVNTKGLGTVFPNAANGDIMEYYDAVGDSYKRTDYFAGFGWFGEFTTIVPTRGYWYYSQNTTLYNWTYQP